MKSVATFMVSSCVVLFALYVQAEEIRGKVVSISDGDTVTVLDANNKMFKLRLDAIDAPESSQAFGTKSKEALASLVHRKDVLIHSSGTDKYGRTLGTLFVNGKNVNEEMVRSGMAWHYKHFSKDENLANLETAARSSGKGLWADKNPSPPWDYRKSKTLDPATNRLVHNSPEGTETTKPAASHSSTSYPSQSNTTSTRSDDSDNSPYVPSHSRSGIGASGRFKESEAEKAYEKAKGVEVVHKKDGTTYERKARSKK